MTKEEVLQKANEYCSEKGYTTETLTDEFKDKFADFFVRKNPDGDINDEGVVADIQFNLNTAFSATSKGITSKQKAFEEKEADYKRQISELNTRLAKKKDKKEDVELPADLKEKLDELEKFKIAQSKQEKYKEILSLAKKGIRNDLHASFEKYAEDYVVSLEEENDVQAKKLTTRFQEIFKDSIGDVRPFSPKQIQKRDDDIIESIPKIKVS